MLGVGDTCPMFTLRRLFRKCMHRFHICSTWAECCSTSLLKFKCYNFHNFIPSGISRISQFNFISKFGFCEGQRKRKWALPSSGLVVRKIFIQDIDQWKSGQKMVWKSEGHGNIELWIEIYQEDSSMGTMSIRVTSMIVEINKRSMCQNNMEIESWVTSLTLLANLESVTSCQNQTSSTVCFEQSNSPIMSSLLMAEQSLPWQQSERRKADSHCRQSNPLLVESTTAGILWTGAECYGKVCELILILIQ